MSNVQFHFLTIKRSYNRKTVLMAEISIIKRRFSRFSSIAACRYSRKKIALRHIAAIIENRL
jgi:hypothetical protein